MLVKALNLPVQIFIIIKNIHSLYGKKKESFNC